MASAPLLDASQDSTAIVIAVQNNPGLVLLNTEKFDAFYDKLKADAPVDADVSTNKGRDALRKFAATVRSEKARIDKARLSLTKEWRDMTAQANAAGKVIEQRLEQLAVEVRQPLTEWEEAENARLANCRDTIARMRGAATVTIVDTVASVQERGTEIWGIEIDADVYGDLAEEAQSVKAQTVATLKEALVRLKREEAERAELEKLRAEKEERERIEADRLAEQQRIEGRRQYARDIIEHIHQCGLGFIGGKSYPYVILIRELEEKITVSEDEFGDMAGDVERARKETLARVLEAQQAQIERDKQEAAQRAVEEARQEDARKAAAAQAEKDRKHAAELQAERDRAAEAERAAQAERDRIAAEQAEQAKRDADQKHRSAVMKAAKEAIMTCGVDEEAAKKVVLLIRSGEVPNVTLRF